MRIEIEMSEFATKNEMHKLAKIIKRTIQINMIKYVESITEKVE
mgnify:CR=1 FL=1